MRRLSALLGTAAVLLGIAVVGAPGAGAKALAMSSCSRTTNAVLAVDFGHWGGPIVRSCGSTPTTGFALLNQGGFRTEGTQHDGPAFICRIASSSFRGGAGYPTKADEACVRTPPATAYWSYWHAAAGQNTWSYSQLGAMSHRATPGSVEYWQFGGTNVAGTQGRPTITPAQVRANNAAPRPTSGGGAQVGGRTTTAAPDPGTDGDRRSAAATTSAARGPATSGAASTGRPSATQSSTAPSTGSPSASPASTAGSSGAPSKAASSGPRIIDAKPASATPEAKSDSGSVLPLVLVGALVVILGGGAGWSVLRRRRADAEL